jgi:putative redox protein
MALIHTVATHGDFGLTHTDAAGNQLQTDIAVESGGRGQGFRPMQALLAALIGCSEVDIVSILKKQKQEVTAFRGTVEGKREEGKEPSLWTEINMHIVLEGNIESAKAVRAVELSMEKYCSVAETLRRAGAVITYTLEVNGVSVEPKS